ncbi:MAG: response regulator transcription factor [Gammaproteobacteria bacterium]
MSNKEKIVYIVDDDDAVRDSLLELLDSVGIHGLGFSSAREFLDGYDLNSGGCLVLDIRMPGMSGLDLQKQLTESNASLPIIFITGHGDVPMAVEAMKRGAVEFIQKPFRDQDLLDAIQIALENSKRDKGVVNEREETLKRIESLTNREREVLDWVVDGHPNKVIAIELGISQRTVENHRAHVMEKMNVRTTANLIKQVLLASPKD